MSNESRVTPALLVARYSLLVTLTRHFCIIWYHPCAMGTTVTTPRWPGRRTEAVMLLVILIIAAWFRFYQLDSMPPGFTHDERDTATMLLPSRTARVPI